MKCETKSEAFDSNGERWIRCPVCRKEARVADVQIETIRRHVESRARGENTAISDGEAPKEWGFAPR